MPTELPRRHQLAEVVVGIGGRGHETYHAAVRLGAEEATLRQVPLRLVHGSRPSTWAGSTTAAAMESRQQRGRRLVNGAARDLDRTPLGQGLRIRTESSPQTGVDLLLAHGRTAVLLVLQRADGWDVPVGPTTREVTAAAVCPTVVTRSHFRPAREVAVLVLLDAGRDPGPALTLAFVEASLRGIVVRVIDGGGDLAGARTAVRRAAAANPGVVVRHDAVAHVAAAADVREASRDAALLVVVRPARTRPDGLVAVAVDEATCPVLLVAPLDAGV